MNTFNKKDAFLIVISLMTFGIGWVANNQTTVISYTAIGLVWIFGLILKRYGKRPTKAGLTITVFGVAIVLALLFQPVTLPLFPLWTGDVPGYATLLIAYVAAFLQMASGVVAYATGVYNILLAQVLEKTPTIASAVWRGFLSLF